MKTNLLLILLFSLTFLNAQNPQKIQIQSGGYDREYLLYFPSSYPAKKPQGIIVCLHGFNRTMEDFFDQYPIAPVADSLNLVVLAPQALPEQDPAVIEEAESLTALGIDIPLNAVWGCGLRVKATWVVTLLDTELNALVDDTGFIRQIFDKTISDYAISPDNLFLFGTSMGGFMSYQYAMINGDSLGGFVSVCGSMGTAIEPGSENLRTPLCDFHSVDDEVVPYSGTLTYDMGFMGKVKVSLCQPKESVIDYWVKKNHTVTDPVMENVNYYLSTNDKTVEKLTWPNPDGKNEVVHYRIHHASHEYYFKKENGDCMDYNEEVIKFLNKHTKQNTSGIPFIFAENFSVAPNPVETWCTVYGTRDTGESIGLYDLTGKRVKMYLSLEGETSIDLSDIPKGLYLLKYRSKTVKVIKK